MRGTKGFNLSSSSGPDSLCVLELFPKVLELFLYSILSLRRGDSQEDVVGGDGLKEGRNVKLGRGELVVSRVNGCKVSKGFSNSCLGFLEAMCKLLDVTDYLLEGSSGGLAFGINAVQLSLKDIVGSLGREEGIGARAEKQRDAGGVECVDVL